MTPQKPASNAVVRYVTISSLVHQKTVTPKKNDLEHRLKTKYGAETIESLNIERAKPPKERRPSIPACITAIQNLSEESNFLKESALDVVVIDQESELPLSLLSSTCQHLKSIMASGIDVGIYFKNSNLISLNDISELTTSDEFIRIYLKDIWKPNDLTVGTQRNLESDH